jgi:glycerophosphoryl diester phosphodiesterase
MLVVAHRAPRSAAACRAIADAGATVFEIDVQIWHGRLVVSHYLPLLGSRLRHDGWRLAVGWRQRREPPLAQAADLVPADGTILLDLKETQAGRREALVAAIIDTLPNSSRYIACSPFADDLDALHAKGFSTWRTVDDEAQLQSALAAGDVADDVVTADHRLLSAAVIARLHAHLTTVVAWTINDVERVISLRECGLDGVTTDSLAVMRAVA